MAVELRQSRRFAAPSPITRYWLANCVGFALTGGSRGKVERVLADLDSYDPLLLEVRMGLWRVRQIPAAAVVEVIPADRLLVVDRRLAHLPDRRRDVSLRLRWTARNLWRGLAVAIMLLGALTAAVWRLSQGAFVALGGLTAKAWRLSQRAWALGTPRVAQLSRRGGGEAVRLGSEAIRLVRAVPWQSYGRSAARTSRRGGDEAVRLGGEATRLVRSVPWQSYGHSARSASTRLAHARSLRRPPHRRTKSPDRRNAGSS